MKLPRPARRRVLLLRALLLTILIGLLTWGWTPDDLTPATCDRAENAAWISVDWTAQPVDEAAVRALVADAERRQMRDLFPYVTYLKTDGTFSPSYAHAAEFVAAVHRASPALRVSAWIGLPLRNPRGIGGWVELADAPTRAQIVTFIHDLLARAPFDGIHLDAETVQSGDPDFLRLLDEVRATLGPDQRLSVASSAWVPDQAAGVPVLADYRWTSTYYQAVGTRVDQIAAMTYDSSLLHPALYRLWMREQTRGITQSLRGTDAEVLIGVSVAHEPSLAHNPAVENLASGLAGLCAGLESDTAVQGVAVYADWDFSQSDWQTWEAWQH